MPEKAMQGNCEVRPEKTVRDQQGHDAAKEGEVLEEYSNGVLKMMVCAAGSKWVEQAQVHGDAAQLEGEVPPVVMIMVDDEVKKNLFVQFAKQQKKAAGKEYGLRAENGF